MSDETSVMFEIGVMEHPATKARLDSLTRQVIEAQAKMTQGVERIGAVATTVSQSVTPLLAQIKAYRESSVGAIDDVRGAIIRLHALAEKRVEQVIQVVVKGAEAAEMGQAKPMDIDIRLPADLEQKFNRVGAQIEGLRQDAADSIRVNIDVPGNLKNVFKELGDVSVEEANRIESAFNESISKLPQSVTANTQLIKQEYAKRVASQAEAYGKMATDLDSALEKQGDATERMNMNMVKGARSLIGMTKGFAELGLMSAESTEQLAKGMVVVQGLFDIVDGAADLLEVYAGSMKAVRQSTEAANKVAEIQKAMMGPQFVQLKAYQAQLAQEAVAANTATAANTRLNASRGVQGGVAASATRVAAGATGSAVGGATTAAVGGAAGAAGVGAVGTGAVSSVGVALAPIAAFVAALASVSLVAYQLSEVFSGTATKAGSLTDTIASTEVSFGAWLIRLGRTDKSVMDSQSNSTLTKSAQSQISTERAERKTKEGRIKTNQREGLENIDRDARNEKQRLAFDEDARSIRARSENTGSIDASIAAEMKIQAETMQRLAENQSIVDKSNQGGIVSDKEAKRAKSNVDFFQNQVTGSQVRQNATVTNATGSKLDDEMKVGLMTSERLNEQLMLKNKLIVAGMDSSKEYAAVVTMVNKYRQEELGSLEKQKSLVKEKLNAEIQGQQKIRDLLKSQLDTKTQQLQRSQDERASAIGNFSKLGQIEKQQAIDALALGRKKGGGALDDTQKDLLRSVGTKEAVRLANEGDAAEAKKFGFDEKNFGAGFDKEQKGFAIEKRQLEAKLSTSYDVSVKLTNDTTGVVEGVSKMVTSQIADANREMFRKIEQAVLAQKADLSKQSTDQFRQLKAARQ